MGPLSPLAAAARSPAQATLPGTPGSCGHGTLGASSPAAPHGACIVSTTAGGAIEMPVSTLLSPQQHRHIGDASLRRAQGAHSGAAWRAQGGDASRRSPLAGPLPQAAWGAAPATAANWTTCARIPMEAHTSPVASQTQQTPPPPPQAPPSVPVVALRATPCGDAVPEAVSSWLTGEASSTVAVSSGPGDAEWRRLLEARLRAAAPDCYED